MKAATLRLTRRREGCRAHTVTGRHRPGVVDRHAERFEDAARGAVLVTSAAPDIAARTPAGRQALWFHTLPDPAQLAELAELAEAFAQGRLTVPLDAVVGLEGLAAAIERNKTGHRPGKTVVEMGR